MSVFTQTPNSTVSGANVIAIVNGDGYNDLIITDPGPTGGASPTVSVLLQDSSKPGTFLAAVAYPTAPYSVATSIVATDVNGDGHPDIVEATGPAQTITNGVQPNVPGVLLQNASDPGTFGALQALP